MISQNLVLLAFRRPTLSQSARKNGPTRHTPQSVRSAFIGSVEAARSAGRILAAAAQAPSARIENPKTCGSQLRISNSCAAMRRPAPIARGIPINSPIATITRAGIVGQRERRTEAGAAGGQRDGNRETGSSGDRIDRKLLPHAADRTAAFGQRDLRRRQAKVAVGLRWGICVRVLILEHRASRSACGHIASRGATVSVA